MGESLEYSIGDDSADMEAAFFFGLPFGVAGRITRLIRARQDTNKLFSLANEEEQVDSIGGMKTGLLLDRNRLQGAFQFTFCVVALMLLCILIAMEIYTSRWGYG